MKELLQKKSVQRLFLGAAMFLGVILFGMTAYYMVGGWSLSDSIYMVIITTFSVGYEEVQPVTTVVMRAITMLIIVAGDASKVYFVGSLVQFITEGEIGKAMDEHRKSRDIDNIKDHAIVCGYGRIGQTLTKELAAKKFPFLIVDNNAERVDLAHQHGYLALIGDAGTEETLNQAKIARATVLCTVLPNDMVNVFITLTARDMRPDMRIIARAEDLATEKKLKQAGANEIILPAYVGGMQIANSITHPSLDDVLKDEGGQLKKDLHTLGVKIIHHTVKPNGVDDQKSLQSYMKGIESTTMVLAIKKPDGGLLQHPPATYKLQAHDVLLMLSHQPD